MKAFVIKSYGKKEKLHLTEVERPSVKDNEVLVEIHAAALNPVDSHIKGVDYSFVFMYADGNQLQQITRLIESGAIKPVVDKVFPFEQANEALEYMESGRAKGKVVVKVK